MTAQDEQPAAHDTEILAAIDRVLTDHDPVGKARRNPSAPPTQSIEAFCADLAAAAPRADPAYRELLGRRLTAIVEQRRRRSRAIVRLGSVIHAPRRRVVPVVLAVLVAVGGIGTYLHGQGPTPVSAQAVLQRARAVSPGPNAAAHSTYRLSASGGISGTADLWVGSDADGILTQFALTQTVSENGRPAPDLSGRLVQTDAGFQMFDPATNTVSKTSSDMPPLYDGSSSSTGSEIQSLEGILMGTLAGQKITRAVSTGTEPNALNLRQQTLDGVSVYAIDLGDPTGQTLYFSTQSYVLEGADWQQGGRSWQARLDDSSYQPMPLSGVPANTFTLNAPASATVVTLPAPSKPKPASSDQILRAAAAACGTTPDALAAAQQAGNKSLLAICQETAPTMTADQLVTAILVPFKADLDAQVAAGTLGASDEATRLDSLRTKLTVTVTNAPGGAGGPGIKKP